MKTFLLFFFLPTLTLGQAWAPIGAKWTYTQQTMNPSYTTYTTIESIADTVVGGQSCRALKKIERTGPATADTSEFYMYSNSNMVYVLMNTTWCLLYDFNAQQGDTIHLACFPNGMQPYNTVTVDSVDMVSINGNMRKRFFYNAPGLANDFSGIVIEGIGNNIDMFPVPDLYMRGPLRCYEDSEVGLYKNQYYTMNTAWTQNCDQIITGIDEQTVNEYLKVFPNPFSTQLAVSVSDNAHTTISLCDFLGRQVLRQTFTKSTTIDTEQLPDDIYFYELSNDKGILKTGKVVRQRH